MANDKLIRLLALGKKRKHTRYPGYHGLENYHRGAYECVFVSPYTKTAGNVQADIFVMLQDWADDRYLAGPFDPCLCERGYDCELPTNLKLSELLNEFFGKQLPDVFATNLFPFIKIGPIRAVDFIRAAKEFALPQIEIVQPKLVICLGLAVFKALSEACGRSAKQCDINTAVNNPFTYGNARIWCQAHTGWKGQANRKRKGANQVEDDWRAMKGDFDDHLNSLGCGSKPIA
jgi:restriction system protein